MWNGNRTRRRRCPSRVERMAKQYRCPYCGISLTHSEAFRHVQYECAQRPRKYSVRHE